MYTYVYVCIKLSVPVEQRQPHWTAADNPIEPLLPGPFGDQGSHDNGQKAKRYPPDQFANWNNHHFEY